MYLIHIFTYVYKIPIIHTCVHTYMDTNFIPILIQRDLDTDFGKEDKNKCSSQVNCQPVFNLCQIISPGILKKMVACNYSSPSFHLCKHLVICYIDTLHMEKSFKC